jgi:hypothetical protein
MRKIFPARRCLSSGRNGELRDPLEFTPLTVRCPDSPIRIISVHQRWLLVSRLLSIFCTPQRLCGAPVSFQFRRFLAINGNFGNVFCVPLPVPSARVPPPPPFLLSLQIKHLFNSTLGWPLGHAWATLGPPKGHPRVTQSQSQTQVGRGSQRFTKYQVLKTKYWSSG